MPSDSRVTVVINTDGTERISNPARCPGCFKTVERHGLEHFPPHIRRDGLDKCELSGWTPAEARKILADREPVPGRYVRPHP